MYINDLNINISLQTKAVSQKSFGVPLVVGSHAGSTSFLLISELAELTSAGYATDSAEYTMAAKILSQSPRVKQVAVLSRAAAITIPEALTALLDTYSGFYAIMIAERDKVSLHAAGDWALANERLFIGCSADVTALDGRNNIREAYLIHNAADTYPECALAGCCLPHDPGTITWKWKTPVGVSASTYSTAELNAIRIRNGQTLSERAGTIYSDEGITTGGEFIDVIQARDFIAARLGEDIFALMIKNKKISFDDVGFAKIDSVLRARFDQCGRSGIIARAESEADKAKSDGGEYMYQVHMPERSEIPENDRAERKLAGVEFSFTIAGAVHQVDVNGVITV